MEISKKEYEKLIKDSIAPNKPKIPDPDGYSPEQKQKPKKTKNTTRPPRGYKRRLPDLFSQLQRTVELG